MDFKESPKTSEKISFSNEAEMFKSYYSSFRNIGYNEYRDNILNILDSYGRIDYTKLDVLYGDINNSYKNKETIESFLKKYKINEKY